MNKKVKNAHSVIIDNIKFKSKLEGYCYQKFKEAGILLDYEPMKFPLLKGFLPTSIKLFTPKKNKSNGYVFKPYNYKIRDITYTPDFVIDYKNICLIIETKGKPNDSYPIKKKLFIKFCQEVLSKQIRKPIVFMEPHNQKQVDECLNIVLTNKFNL